MITSVLRKAHPIWFALYGGLAAFSAYFSMYAFRKPFTAATYESVEGWTALIDFKIALVIAQVIGYAISKFIGIKVVSEMTTARRGLAIVLLVAFSWLALALFAIVPPEFKVACLFLNGLPLGMIWGLVFGYLEGRRTTEILGAMLCASFIISSGIVKSVGVWLIFDMGVPEFWMPAATGAVFFPVLLISVFGLSQLPAPNEGDVAARTERRPMDGTARVQFLRRNGPGIAFLVLAYILFTVFRDFRDNFAAEVWAELGFAGVSSVFTLSELPVAVITLLAIASLVFIKGNRVALAAIHGLIIIGSLMIGGSTFAFELGLLSPLAWMVLSGAGLYLAYTPFNAMLFDRLIAATHQVANAGFLIYVADASGYLGSVVLLLYKNFGATDLDWLPFFIALAYSSSLISAVLMVCSALYFSVKLRSTVRQPAMA